MARDERNQYPHLVLEVSGGSKKDVHCTTRGDVMNGPGMYICIGVPYTINGVGKNYRLFGRNCEGVESVYNIVVLLYRKNLVHYK